MAVVVLATVVVACGGGDQPNPDPIPPVPVSVYKSLGSVQCTGGGTTLAAIQPQLTSAGIGVFSASCGLDGLSYPTVCGAGDGKIAIFGIPPTQLAAAVALSFGDLTTLPNATRTSTC